jgi:hypothetical protein
VGSNLNQLAVQAHAIPGSVSWDDVHRAIAREAKRRGEWAGMPMPVKGMRMVVHPSYPFADQLNQTFCPEDQIHVCRDSDVDETISHRNSWRSYRDGKELTIWRDSKGFYFTHGRRQNQGTMLLDTLGAARSWDFQAELKAMETLKRHITEWAYQAYVMTGSFLETSPKSHVIYLFRRLRPTLALTAQPDRKGRDVGVRILCALCLHPIGLFDGTWAGALTPSDDVLAHLLMMRGCEAKFWAHANQHPAWAPEAGI